MNSADRRLALVVMLLATMLAMPSARAGGSMSVEDVYAAVAGAPRLVDELRAAAKQAETRGEAVVCGAEVRLGNQWRHLGGLRVVPIECHVGARTLRIEGDAVFKGRRGRRLSLDDEGVFERAVAVEQQNLRWTWQ